jgi:hypothetical protein
MRRIEMVLAVAAMMGMMLALMAGPALAQTDTLPPFGQGTPGGPQGPQTPTTNTATATPVVGKNCNGLSSSNFLKGPGPSLDTTLPPELLGQPLPGSAAQPVIFGGQPNFNGPATSGFAQSPQTPAGPGNNLSDFQQGKRDAAALCRAAR